MLVEDERVAELKEKEFCYEILNGNQIWKEGFSKTPKILSYGKQFTTKEQFESSIKNCFGVTNVRWV